jgi:hypothetical protein
MSISSSEKLEYLGLKDRVIDDCAQRDRMITPNINTHVQHRGPLEGLHSPPALMYMASDQGLSPVFRNDQLARFIA